MEDKEVKVDTVSVEDIASSPVDDAASADAAPADDCEIQVDALIAEVRELNDKYLRVAAELENTRRRAALDCESAARTRAMSVARSFLPVMDAIDAALSHNPDDAGILAMSRAMDAAFSQVGITRVESVGQPLNPQFHNAIQVVPATPENPSNTVVQEMQPGYTFGDSVLRTAMVVVAK